MTAPKYQNIAAEQIPNIADDGVRLRLIAGELGGKRGPASTFSPLILAHGIISAGKSCALTIPTTMEAGIYVTHGELRSIGENLEARKLVVFNNDQDMIHLTAKEDSEFLLLAGEPIHEPMVQYGPFVMNTSEEIHQAMLDYEAGKMGVIDF
jgi:redox-sensitive bicupin YhaK (pirin superfamily)